MIFIKGSVSDFDLVYEMMLRARKRLYDECIFQWDERYPKAEMIHYDLSKGYTSLVKSDKGKIVAFFTSNSICEDDVHDHINWIYNGDKWIILHRLCVEPKYQDLGTGQQILRLFESDSKESGFESIRIDVFSTNLKAIHLYEKFDYCRVGEAICERGPFFVYEKMI